MVGAQDNVVGQQASTPDAEPRAAGRRAEDAGMGCVGHADQRISEPHDAAAGLVYVSDEMPGWRRVRRGTGFAYLTESGASVRDKTHLQRIRSLAIPPAYTQVWICPLAEGHLQATGRDARGRKQYRYHAEWEVLRHEQKFERMLEFGEALPRLRRHIARDLERPRLDRTKVVAAVVRLLDFTALRVGNALAARATRSQKIVRGPRVSPNQIPARSKSSHTRMPSACLHAWVQWLIDEQMAAAAKVCPLMQIFPHRRGSGGADAWIWQDVFAAGVSAGVPADLYNQDGQDWGLSVFIPHRLRAANYEPSSKLCVA